MAKDTAELYNMFLEWITEGFSEKDVYDVLLLIHPEWADEGIEDAPENIEAMIEMHTPLMQHLHGLFFQTFTAGYLSAKMEVFSTFHHMTN